jgi:hypothetical protein
MTQVYVAALLTVVAAVLVRGIARPLRFYEYPYFMVTAFAVFIVPQLFSLLRFPAGASPRAIESGMLMTLLCVLSCILGYRSAVSNWIVQRTQMPLDDRRLFHFGVLFIVSGLFFAILIGRMTDAERGGSMWTGRVTIYLFFSSLVYPGFSICLRRALSRGDSLAWLWTILGAWIPIVSALYGRREPTALFALTIALTLFYQKRWVAPRWLIGSTIIGATLAIPATTQYRTAVNVNGFEAAMQIDPIGNFKQFLSRPAILELRNACVIIDATERTNSYGWGTAYWDQMVFRFVPAQLLGKQFKEGLMFRTSDQRLNQEMTAQGYRVPTGSTITGMADSFREFGYFGALFFAALAIVFKSLWTASLQPNAVLAQLIYIQISTSAMRAVTHQTVDFLPGLTYNLIFLGIAAVYARRLQSRRSERPMANAIR